MTASNRWLTPLASVEERLARARSMCRFGTYVLGAGGFEPMTADPQGKHWQSGKLGLDCSGFLFWCWGVSRVQRDEAGAKEHLNTTSLVQDARGKARRVELVEYPMPGDAVVYGWYKGKSGAKRVGHVGLVVGVGGGAGSIFERLRVIHCSAGNYRAFGYAVAETGGNVFNGGKDTVFVRPLP